MKKITAFIQTIPKNIKILIIAILAVIVLAVIVKLVIHKKPLEAKVPEAPIVEDQLAPVTVPKTYTKAKTPAQIVAQATYQQVATEYAGRTIQFNDSCQSQISSSSVFKLGTKILLDNRSAVPVKIVLDGQTYNLSKYGWQIMTLNELGTFTPSCNEQNNVHTIIVEK